MGRIPFEAQMQRLNLGCGQYPKAGFLNVDVDPLAKADVFHDLSSFPYPFEDARFYLVEMDHVLEHLPSPRDAMREIWRILKPGGTLRLRVPHFSRGFSHYDHKCGFDVTFPLYFDPTFPGGYTGIPFEHVQTRLVWFAQPWLKRQVLGNFAFNVGKMLGMVFDALGNIAPLATSRLFCFWVGGYEEITFELRRPYANQGGGRP